MKTLGLVLACLSSTMAFANGGGGSSPDVRYIPELYGSGSALRQLLRTDEVGAVTSKASARVVLDEVAMCRDAECFGDYLDAHARIARGALERGYAELDKSPLRENVIAACASQLNPHRTQCIADVLDELASDADKLDGTCSDELLQIGGPARPRHAFADSNLGKLVNAMCPAESGVGSCKRHAAATIRRQALRAVPHLRAAVSEIIFYSVQSLACDSGESAVLGDDAAPHSRLTGFGRAACGSDDFARPLTSFNPMKVAFTPAAHPPETIRYCEIHRIQRIQRSASFEMMIRSPLLKNGAYLEEHQIKDIIQRYRAAGESSQRMIEPAGTVNAR